MIKRMSGVRRDWDILVLKSGEIVAVRDVSPGICNGAHIKESDRRGAAWEREGQRRTSGGPGSERDGGRHIE
jgi:hypothetical protein